jgi:hypothetical protein
VADSRAEWRDSDRQYESRAEWREIVTDRMTGEQRDSGRQYDRREQWRDRQERTVERQTA